MLLLSAAALAQVGNNAWPCTRLNWAWRNVWSTCSINSYAPADTAAADHPPAHFRRAPLEHLAAAPTNALAATGEFGTVGAGHAAGVPQMICNNMVNTHGGTNADFRRLRNRCRRAIDAYGGLVNTCKMTPQQGVIRGPVVNSLYTNWQPLAEQQPHVVNVQRLTDLAHKCITDLEPGTFASPSTTCPGLLGWWGVVWNACGFKQYAPQVGGSATESVGGPALAPLGAELSPRFFFATGALAAPPQDASAPGFIFCSPVSHGLGANAPNVGPNAWNERGPRFRSTRCRRALDQFGRSARRCGGTIAMGDATLPPVRGSADKLRIMMLGGAGAPKSLGALAPLCN